MSGQMATFEETVQGLVSKHWADTGRAYHLSNLGGLLNRQFDLVELLKGAKLATYLRHGGVSGIQIVQNPADDQVWGAVPSDVPADAASREKYFVPLPRSKFPSSKEGEDFPPIQREIWRAFSVPLETGKKRFFDRSTNKIFELPESDPAPDNSIEISSKYINQKADNALPSARQLTQEHLKAWLEETGISLTSISEVEPADSNVLSLIFDALSDEELSRISVGLDIVKKLSRSRPKQK